MVIRVAALLLVLAACGGGSKPSTTTVSNSSGASGPASPPTSTAGDARVVQRTQAGGVIDLLGDRSVAMEKASGEMTSHCGPNNYTITQEGEEAIGTDSMNGTPVRTETAWRVHYQCFGSP